MEGEVNDSPYPLLLCFSEAVAGLPPPLPLSEATRTRSPSAMPSGSAPTEPEAVTGRVRPL